MELTCPNKKCGTLIATREPQEATPGGTIIVACPVCATSIEVENPHGDATLTLTEGVWLRPIVETRPAAHGRTRRELVGYEVAEDGEPGSTYFGPGAQIQRRLAPGSLQ